MINGLVSVIITTFKATPLLINAIESVLAQSYSKIEIVVVDDNDPDSVSREYTELLMEKFSRYNNIIYIKHEKNKNGAAARNTGIKACNGEFISFLDDDDVYYRTRIERCVSLLQTNPLFFAVYTSVDIFKNDKFIGVRKASISGYIWKELLLNEGLLGTGSNLFLTRASIESINGFDESFLRYQDVEFMIRISERMRVLATDDVLVRKNIMPTNIPDYIKYKENKELIFNKFNYLIDKLDEKEKNNFYSSHYETLFASALYSCNKKYIKEAIANLKMVKGNLPIKYYLKAWFPHLYKMYQHF